MEKLERIEPFASGYLGAKWDDPEYRIANGMFQYAKCAPIVIEPDENFAGHFYSIYDGAGKIGIRYTYGNGVVVREQFLKAQVERYPEYTEQLTGIYAAMKQHATAEVVHAQETPIEVKLDESRVCWGGLRRNWLGHGNPDFGLLPHLGTEGLRRKIKEYKADHPEKAVFYDSLLLTMDALDVYAQRYQQLAEEMAQSAVGEERKRLQKIADALKVVPHNPAGNLIEAFQAFWLVFAFDGIDSPGRFDQYMIEYYRKAGQEEREYCLDSIWELFHKTRTWNLCISGSDESGKDMTNELSYDILKTARKFRYNTPNLTMRVHKNTPQELWVSAAETIATGIGLPALYNDECVCPALEELGIPARDSHNYCMNGCNQIDIFGKSHMGLEDGEVCLAKCLELAIFNGVSSDTGERIGRETGEIASFVSFDELWKAYKTQVEYATDMAVYMANKSQKIVSEAGVNPLRSCLIEGCMEKGLDYKNHGPVYGHGQILAEGIADTADSLAAVKHFIYEEKKYSPEELLAALKADFEGYEQLYYDFSTWRKFGNDESYVDTIYKDIIEHFYRYLLTKKTFRGGIYGGGCSTFNRTASYAEKIGALPNGKKKGSLILADSIGAVPGCDKKGPTALLCSVLSADETLAKSGNVLQLKFSKNLFRTDTGLNAFIHLAKTYFLKKGQQLSVNVVSLEELLDAQKNPQNHENLIVRVGGYSDYFVRLSPGLQENIIERTELEM